MNRKAHCLLDELQKFTKGLVVEIGTIRQSYEIPSDGFSTVYLARYCQERNITFVSLDNSPAYVELANRVLVENNLQSCSRLIHSARDLPELGEIGFLYLDGSDSPTEALEQFLWALLTLDATVVVDDCHSYQGNRYGKGTEIVHYLQARRHPFEFMETEVGTRALVIHNPPRLQSHAQLEAEGLEAWVRRESFTAIAKHDFTYPRHQFKGRGIVICAGGKRYFTNAWVCAKVLRMLGCELPIQFWHLGEREMSGEMRDLVHPLNVECVDALQHPGRQEVRRLHGWELKAFSLIHCPFREVLFLDADNVPVRNPEFLFETPQYRETGALFWPDFGRLGPERSIWKVSEIDYQDEPEFESGQMVINKEHCWKALHLTMHLNSYSDYYYRHIHGDKETFHMAWRKIAQPYAMPETPVRHLGGCTMLQHDFEGNVLFQHRNMRKWTLEGSNPPVDGFQFEAECLSFLEELRSRWSEARELSTEAAIEAKRNLSGQKLLYVRVGHDYRLMEFLPEGNIGQGAGGMERYWKIIERADQSFRLQISNDRESICSLTQDGDQCWSGVWERFEQMPIRLIPIHH